MKTTLIAAGALLAGLLIGTTWAVVLDYLDPEGEWVKARWVQ